MSADLKRRNVPFSPPDMTEAEANEVRDAILSGWITTGPRTKKLENTISEYIHTEKTVCLNSATAAMEMALRILGVGPGDQVIVPAYTYTATASVVDHVGATIVMVDSQKDNVEMDYDKLAEAITERTKVIVPVDIAGICADVERLREIVSRPEILAKFHPANDIQRRIGRIAISSDCAHSFGASRDGKMAGEIADFSSFSFHAVKNFTTAEGGAMTWNLPAMRRLGVSRCTMAILFRSLRGRPGMSSYTVWRSCCRFTGRIRMLLPSQSLGVGSMISLARGTNAI